MKYNIGDLVWVLERKYIRQGRVVSYGKYVAEGDGGQITEREDYTLKFADGKLYDFDPAQMYKRRIDLVHENSMPYEPGN